MGQFGADRLSSSTHERMDVIKWSLKINCVLQKGSGWVGQHGTDREAVHLSRGVAGWHRVQQTNYGWMGEQGADRPTAQFNI